MEIEGSEEYALRISEKTAVANLRELFQHTGEWIYLALLFLGEDLTTNSIGNETRRFNTHSQELSNNPYPEPN